ncbi:MAG: hypothetical protein AB9907_15610 [Flexilinea sp.]
MNISTDFLILLTGFVLSLFIFSLILGDNWLFRFASSVLSGVLSAYVCILLVEKVFIPKIFLPLSASSGGWERKIVLLAVIAAAVFLFIKIFMNHESGGNFILAILLCVMAAVTIAGVANGTILGLYRGILTRFQPAENLSGSIRYWIETGFVLLGTITSLLYTQHYWIKRKNSSPGIEKTPVLSFFSAIGEVFIGIALGSIFAGCFVASAVILVEQLSNIINTGQTLLQWVK